VIPLTLTDALAFSVALTFAASAVAKLRNPSAFGHGVARYQIIPARLASPASLLIIALELVIAGTFASGFLVRWTSLVALALLAAFAFAVTINLRRGRELPCMCFGSRSEDPISALSLVRIALITCAVVLVRESVSGSSLYPGQGETTEQIFAALTLALGIIAAARWVLVAPAVARLFSSDGGGA
jgi:Methylamine utilisation protein MauE